MAPPAASHAASTSSLFKRTTAPQVEMKHHQGFAGFPLAEYKVRCSNSAVVRRDISGDGQRTVRRSASENLRTVLAAPADSSGGSHNSKRGGNQQTQVQSSPRVKASSAASVKVLQEFNGQDINASLRRSASSQTKSVGSVKGIPSGQSSRPKKSACASMAVTTASQHGNPGAAWTSAGSAQSPGKSGNAPSPSHKSVTSPQKSTLMPRSGRTRSAVALCESNKHKAESKFADYRDGEEKANSRLQSAAHWLEQIRAAEVEERHEVVVRLFELAIECGAQPAEKIFDALQACRERYSRKREEKASGVRSTRKTGKQILIKQERVRDGNERPLSVSEGAIATSSAAGHIVGAERKSSRGGEMILGTSTMTKGGNGDASHPHLHNGKQQQQEDRFLCCESIGDSVMHDRESRRQNAAAAELRAAVTRAKKSGFSGKDGGGISADVHGISCLKSKRKAKLSRKDLRDESVRQSLNELRDSVQSVLGNSEKEGGHGHVREEGEVVHEDDTCPHATPSSSPSLSPSGERSSSVGTGPMLVKERRERGDGDNREEDETTDSADSRDGGSSGGSSSNADDAEPSQSSIRYVDLRSGTDDETSLADIRAAMKSGLGVKVIADGKRNGLVSTAADEIWGGKVGEDTTLSAENPRLKADINTHLTCIGVAASVGLSAKVAASVDSHSRRRGGPVDGDAEAAMSPGRPVSLRLALPHHGHHPHSDYLQQDGKNASQRSEDSGDRTMTHDPSTKKKEENATRGQSSSTTRLVPSCSVRSSTRQGLPEFASQQDDSSTARRSDAKQKEGGEGDVCAKTDVPCVSEVEVVPRQELGVDAAAPAVPDSPAAQVAAIEKSKVSLASFRGQSADLAASSPAEHALRPLSDDALDGSRAAATAAPVLPSIRSMKEMPIARKGGHIRSLSLIGGVLDQVSAVKFPSPVREVRGTYDLQRQSVTGPSSSCDSDCGFIGCSSGATHGVSATLPASLHHRHQHSRSWSSVGAQRTSSNGIVCPGSPLMPRAMSSVGLLRTSSGENIVAIPPEVIAMRSPPRGKWATLGASLMSCSTDRLTNGSPSCSERGVGAGGAVGHQDKMVQDADTLFVGRDQPPKGASERRTDFVAHPNVELEDSYTTGLKGGDSVSAAVSLEESCPASQGPIRPPPQEPANRMVAGYSSMTDILKSEKQHRRHLSGGLSVAFETSKAANTARDQNSATTLLQPDIEVDMHFGSRKGRRMDCSAVHVEEAAERGPAVQNNYSMSAAFGTGVRRRHTRSRSMLEESSGTPSSRNFPYLKKIVVDDQPNGDSGSNSGVHGEKAARRHTRSQSTLEGSTAQVLSSKNYLTSKKMIPLDDLNSGTSGSSPWACKERAAAIEDAASFNCKKPSTDVPVASSAHEQSPARHQKNELQSCVSSSRCRTQLGASLLSMKPSTDSTVSSCSFNGTSDEQQSSTPDLGDQDALAQLGIEEEKEEDNEVCISDRLAVDDDEQYQLAVAMTSRGSKRPYFPKGVTINEDEELQDMDSSGRTLMLSPPPSSAAARDALNVENTCVKSVRSSKLRNVRTNIYYAFRDMRNRSEEGGADNVVPAGAGSWGVRGDRFLQEERVREEMFGELEEGLEEGRTSRKEGKRGGSSTSPIEGGCSGTAAVKMGGIDNDFVVGGFSSREAAVPQPPSPSIRFISICDEEKSLQPADPASEQVQKEDEVTIFRPEMDASLAAVAKERLNVVAEELIKRPEESAGRLDGVAASRVEGEVAGEGKLKACGGGGGVSKEGGARGVSKEGGAGEEQTTLPTPKGGGGGGVSKASWLFRPRCEGKSLPPKEQEEEVARGFSLSGGNPICRQLQSSNQNGVNRRVLSDCQDRNSKMSESSGCSGRSRSSSSRVGRADSMGSSGSTSVSSRSHHRSMDRTVESCRERMRSGGGSSFESLHALTPVREEEEEAGGPKERSVSEERNRKNLEWAAALSLARSHSSLGSQTRSAGAPAGGSAEGGGDAGSCASGGSLHLFPASSMGGVGCPSPPIQFSQEIGGLVLARSAPLARGPLDLEDEISNLSDDDSVRRTKRRERRWRREGSDCRITRTKQGGVSKLARLFCFF